MALSDADFRGIAARQEPRVLLHHEVVKFARAIEAEVHKQDTELIQQMLEAMTQNASTHGLVHMMEENRQRAIAAARARLEPKP